MTHTPDVEHPDCVDVREALSRGQSLSATLEKHAANCPVCAAFQREEAVSAGGDDLFSAVQAAVREERGFRAWLRSLSTRSRVVGAAVWAILLVAGTTYLTPRAAHGPMPMLRIVLVVTVLGALIAIALRIVLRPLQAPPPSRGELVTSFATGLLAPVVFAVLPGSGPYVASLEGINNCTATTACFVIGCIPGAFVLVALRMLDRGAHKSKDVALLAAVTAGLVGNVALELHCPITAPVHLLLGHATVGLAMVVIYFGLTYRATAGGAR